MMFGYGANMWWMWLWGLVAVAGIVVLIVVLVRASSGGMSGGARQAIPPPVSGVPTGKTPRQILDERYAKGELTTEEYRERLTVLGEDH